MLLESVLAEELTAMLLWAILLTNVVGLLVGLFAFFRSKSNNGAISRDVREELRSGREKTVILDPASERKLPHKCTPPAKVFELPF